MGLLKTNEMHTIKQKIIAAYEELAESYNRLIDHKPHNAYYDRPNTLALMPDVAGKSILDAACGPGKYAEILLSKGATLTGFDISRKMVELAKERNGDRCNFFIHDLSQPLEMLKNETFDIVLCALALQYVEDWSLPMQEFHRVLRPQGRLIISIEHPFFEYTFFEATNYFSTEPVKCTWKGFGKPVEVHSYRRPLGACLSAITENGFFIEKLVEPRPTREFEAIDPRHFKELNEFPSFMCIRAVKRN